MRPRCPLHSALCCEVAPGHRAPHRHGGSEGKRLKPQTPFPPPPASLPDPTPLLRRLRGQERMPLSLLPPRPRHPENAKGLRSQGRPLIASAAQTRMQMSDQLCCLSIGRRWKCAAKISGSRKIHPCESRSHGTIGVVHSGFLKAFTSKHMETKTPLDTHVSSCARKCGASRARLPSRFVSLCKFNPSLSF